MQRRRLGPLLAISLAVVCLSPPVLAQRGRGKGGRGAQGSRQEAPLETFERMTPEEREQAMANLPPERRDKLEKQLKAYDRLTPSQKSQLEWFNHLPPARQEAFRKA